MRFVTYARRREWTPMLGYGLFVGFMAVGYYYNVTFVQLGLLDLGTRLVGMTEEQVSVWMAALALLTLVVAVVSGVTMDRRGWSSDLLVKFRLLFGVVALQLLLTLVAPWIRTVPAFGAWILAGSVALGGRYRGLRRGAGLARSGAAPRRCDPVPAGRDRSRRGVDNLLRCSGVRASIIESRGLRIV